MKNTFLATLSTCAAAVALHHRHHRVRRVDRDRLRRRRPACRRILGQHDDDVRGDSVDALDAERAVADDTEPVLAETRCAQLGHVVDQGVHPVAAGLGPESVDHRRRRVDRPDGEAPKQSAARDQRRASATA